MREFRATTSILHRMQQIELLGRKKWADDNENTRLLHLRL
jgi:hypothetical protein